MSANPGIVWGNTSTRTERNAWFAELAVTWTDARFAYVPPEVPRDDAVANAFANLIIDLNELETARDGNLVKLGVRTDNRERFVLLSWPSAPHEIQLLIQHPADGQGAQWYSPVWKTNGESVDAARFLLGLDPGRDYPKPMPPRALGCCDLGCPIL